MTRHKIFAATLPFLALLIAGMTSCKTSEANYRTAYEIARQKADNALDSTIYNRIRNEARPSVISIDGEELPMRTEFVTLTADAGGEEGMLKRYSIVTAQFKQIFNARDMQKRLVQNGYESFVVNTQEPLYYVVASSHESLEEAFEGIKKVKTDVNITLRDPFPWVLESAKSVTSE